MYETSFIKAYLDAQAFYLYSRISIFGQGPTFQIVSNRGYPGVTISDFGSRDYCTGDRRVGHNVQFHVARVQHIRR